MQACNHFLYDSGISRSQTTILLFTPIFFWNPNSLEKLFILNPRSHQVSERQVICANDAEFYKYYDWQWKSCQIGTRLYVTGGSQTPNRCSVVAKRENGQYLVSERASMAKPRQEHSACVW